MPERAKQLGVELVDLTRFAAGRLHHRSRTIDQAKRRPHRGAPVRLDETGRPPYQRARRHVDEGALYDAIKVGIVHGAALDAFSQEPPTITRSTCPQVIATPHLGASTYEAQISVAVDVAEATEGVHGEPVATAVNASMFKGDNFERRCT